MQPAQDFLKRWPGLDLPAKGAHLRSTIRLAAGPIADALSHDAARAERALVGLWNRASSTWSADASVQRTIANRLGWLSAPILMAESIDRLESFASSIRVAGFTDVVLLGMGGSSLAPEVLRAVLGIAPGWPRLHMLDSTDPAAVRAVASPALRTLYLFASKSGTTIEPNSLAAHFRQVLEDAGVAKWADHFVAITDEGTELARRARADSFRDVFINPSDIGGRYSAVSFFGLVPAALMGQDIRGLIGWALSMLASSEPGGGPITENPAGLLGLAAAAAARTGRDKLTLVSPAALEPFGLWVEQLVAESTGKNGVGMVPIAGEPSGEATVYGSDRFFVHLGHPSSAGSNVRITESLQSKAPAPTAEIDILEPTALGAEFVRWEVATAIAGALLGINPFDEPNVQQAKDATRVLLSTYVKQGALPLGPAERTLPSGVTLTSSAAARDALGALRPGSLLATLRPGDYFALLAYLGPDIELYEELRALRVAVRDRARVATMFGYGPRYLHSTGQLHKGGPKSGVFVLISAVPDVDVPIPGERYSFGTLELAQALGDFSSLDALGRRALHVHLPTPTPGLIRHVADVLLAEREG